MVTLSRIWARIFMTTRKEVDIYVITAYTKVISPRYFQGHNIMTSLRFKPLTFWLWFKCLSFWPKLLKIIHIYLDFFFLFFWLSFLYFFCMNTNTKNCQKCLKNAKNFCLFCEKVEQILTFSLKQIRNLL